MDGQTGRYDAELRESLLQDITLAESPADDRASTASVGVELKSLARLSAPVIVQLTAQYAISVVNQLFIGHLGARPLAAAAIGNTVSVCSPAWDRLSFRPTLQITLRCCYCWHAVVQLLLVLFIGSVDGTRYSWQSGPWRREPQCCYRLLRLSHQRLVSALCPSCHRPGQGGCSS